MDTQNRTLDDDAVRFRSKREVEDQPERLFNAEHWTQEFVVEAKSRDLPPPSPEVKVSLQVPAYKEISDDGVLEHLDHLPLFLERTFEQLQEIQNPAQVEVLINVNNSANVDEMDKLGNLRSVQLLRLITDPSISVSQAMTELFQAGWIINPDQPQEFVVSAEVLRQRVIESGFFDESESDQIDHFVQGRLEENKERLVRAIEVALRFQRIITLGKDAIQRGLRLCLLDCTDGMYISKVDENDEVHPNSQGARRRLLSEVAKKRAHQVNANPWIIPIDADCRMAEGALQSLLDESGDEKDTPQIFFSVPEFVPESYIVGYDDQEVIEVTEHFQHFAELRMIRSMIESLSYRLDAWRAGDQQYYQTTASVTPFAGSYGFKLDAYERVNGWSLDKDSGEDANMMARLRDEVGDLKPRAKMVEVTGRVRKESFLGNDATIASLTDRRFMIDAQVASALTAESQEEVIFDNFVQLLHRHLVQSCAAVLERQSQQFEQQSFFARLQQESNDSPQNFFTQLQQELMSSEVTPQLIIEVLYKLFNNPVMGLWILLSSGPLYGLASRFAEQRAKERKSE